MRPASVPRDAIERHLVVPHDRAGWRLDRFLTWKVPRLSRTRAQKILRTQAFAPDGRKLGPNDIVRAGDVIVIYRPPMPEPPAPREFGVLYEDEDVVVVDKPAGLPVHPTARYHENTLTALLRGRYPDRVTLTHRLDRETSGIVVCARNRQAERRLKAQFESRTVTKRYLALVRGVVAQDLTTIDLPLELCTEGILRNRMKVAPPGRGLESRTLIEVASRGRTTTLVSAYPRTGRQHQIRVHLDAIGHPIVGDKLYGVDEALFLAFCDSGLDDEMHKTLGMQRHALHAHEVRLAHPRSGEPLEVRSALPDDIRQHFLDDQGALQ
ncbi:MAG: RluA family pseudouridine synthase [Deltaproteobacteria bacterium]|nr:RluA family pseudouridine synthase [Deltaproteobacteria bacterium]